MGGTQRGAELEKKMAQEIIRSGFDIDGVKVELLFDEEVARFTIATRWVNLVHLNVPAVHNTEKWKRIMLDRASAVFEAVCLNGATKEVARVANIKAQANDRAFFTSTAAYEREVLRKTALALPA